MNLKRMRVVDCPEHPFAALQLAAGVICCGCGREVVDTPIGLVARDAPAALVAELRSEWEGNRTVAAFVIEARATALGMLEEAYDA